MMLSAVLFSQLLVSTHQSDSPWILTSSSLPSETKYFATLGNGQLAMTPFLQHDSSPSINVNCLYNGDSWTSHRARLPNMANYQPILPDADYQQEFSLDMRRGEFRASYRSDDWSVDHKVFILRNIELDGVIVNHFTAEAFSDNFLLDIILVPGPDSDDITMMDTPDELQVNDNNLGIDTLLYTCQETLETEFNKYQDGPSPVCYGWMIPSSLNSSANDVSATSQLYITVVDSSLEKLITQVNLLIEMNPTVDDLFNLHYDAWNELWSRGTLEVTGDPELERVVLASQYYILSSLPSAETSREFCGLSPGSLAYGDEAMDYQVVMDDIMYDPIFKTMSSMKGHSSAVTNHFFYKPSYHKPSLHNFFNS